MVRVVPTDRLEKLLAAAAAAFVAHGFERTQMDDIAGRLGVSKGTIYRSVASKEALFAAVLLHADDPASLSEAGVLEAIEWSELSVRLREELAARLRSLGLASAVASKASRRKVGDIGDEVEALAAGVYATLAERRVAVMVLDRCASEIPAITGDWYEQGRYSLVDLWERYLDQRHDRIVIPVDRRVLARTIVELITLWAVKMPWDPSPRSYPNDPALSCAAMVRALVTGGHR